MIGQTLGHYWDKATCKPQLKALQIELVKLQRQLISEERKVLLEEIQPGVELIDAPGGLSISEAPPRWDQPVHEVANTAV